MLPSTNRKCTHSYGSTCLENLSSLQAHAETVCMQDQQIQKGAAQAVDGALLGSPSWLRGHLDG